MRSGRKADSPKGESMITWTHVALSVSDLERSVGFYREICGLSVVRDRRAEGGRTVWLGYPPARSEHDERGGAGRANAVHERSEEALTEDPSFVLVLDPTATRPSTVDHLGFECSTRELVDEKARLGGELGILVGPPKDSGGSVGYWVMLRDPDGHRVEFSHGQPLRGLR
jgi:lactoylglutathione lyase